jgi:predicted CoA-substrate-specific enzyme activase
LHFAGIDIGSTMTKAVILDANEAMVSVIKGPTGPEHRRLAHQVMEMALAEAELPLEEISYIVATGYGRLNVPFADRQITELSCHTRGISTLFSNARTAVDMGGQDTKCMKIRDGKMANFVMNDKCAAGTGRFLEIVAGTLGIKVEDMGKISLTSSHKVQISNFCTVFAQQEVVSRLSEGVPMEDILAGLHDALASRVASLARRVGIEQDVVLTGGVAKNTGVVQAMRENLGCDFLIPDDPLITGALGAAILAKEHAIRSLAKGESHVKRPRRLDQATFFGQGGV